MKVMMRTRFQSPLHNLFPGQAYDLDEPLATSLVDGGYAESLEKEKRETAVKPETEKATGPRRKNVSGDV